MTTRYISSCCGEPIPYEGEDYGICPDCHDHCDIINEDEALIEI